MIAQFDWNEINYRLFLVKKKENEILRKEILALRTNPQVLEEKARENLGLIKPGETFYRIIPKED